MRCISYAIPSFLRPTTTLSPPLKLSFPTFRHCTASAAVYPALPFSEREEIRSPELVAREYADLNLSDKFCQEVGHVRIRQHVNPLRSSLMVPAEVQDWNAVYKDATLPLMVDIGSGKSLFALVDFQIDVFYCFLVPHHRKSATLWYNWCIACNMKPNLNQGFTTPLFLLMYFRTCVQLKFEDGLYYGSGRFLLWLAKRSPESRNYLGLEIRPKLVKRAEYWVDELSLKNIHFIFANATVSFKQLLSTYPGPLVLVSVLCPDPYFKKKHHKRRVVQKPLVESIIDALASGGQIFIQSDVLEVAVDMRNYFDAEPDKLVHTDNIDPNMICDNEGWLLKNPMGIRTEREIHAEFEGAKIYRRMYQKM